MTSGKVVLAGSLVVPDRAKPSPGVVLVGGSGASDRDNDTYFPPLREHLVAAGIAVASYDKRGVGESTGDWREATIGDFASDAVAVLEFVRAQPGVRAEATGLFGHSEGGWVVLRAAAGRADLPWVITNSGPGTTPAVQERYAWARTLEQAGGADLDDGLTAYDRLVEAARRGAGFDEAVRLLRAFPVRDDFWAELDTGLWEFTRRKQDHDPVPDARRLRCPHLALFGGADRLVPVAESIRLFGAAACAPERGERATLTVEVFPRAGHRVQLGDRPAPGHLETLARWIHAGSTETSTAPA